MVSIQEKMWIEIAQHPTLLRKLVLFLGISIVLAIYSLLWNGFPLVGCRFIKEITFESDGFMSEKQSCGFLNSVQYPITFDIFPILLFRLSPL